MKKADFKTYGGGFLNDLFAFSFLIIPLWLLFGGYCAIRKSILKKHPPEATTEA